MCDQQKGRVYEFERAELWPDEEVSPVLDKAETRSLLRKALKRYGLRYERGKVSFTKRGGARAGGSARSYGIAVSTTPRRHVVLHEAAHMIAMHKAHCLSFTPHGPEFAAVLCDLYQRYCNLRGCRSAMRSYGIRIAAVAACGAWRRGTKSKQGERP